MTIQFAFLSEGKLFLKNGEAEPQLITSQFAESVRERAAQIQRKQAWKYQGPNARYSCGGALFCAEDGLAPPAYIGSISKGRTPGEILYSLHTAEIAGVFYQDVGERKEQRVVHSNRLQLHEISYSAQHDLIACSIARNDGSVNLGVMRRESPDAKPVTEGDVVDGAPFWQPGPGKKLLYQSSGIARGPSGQAKLFSAVSIKLLDLEKGEIENVLENPKTDFLMPKMNVQGDLFFIQKPYQESARPSLVKMVTDLILFPFRLIRAVFFWLQFFSLKYTGKPLTSSGDVKSRTQNPLEALIFGNITQALTGANSEPKSEAIPKTWLLKKRQSDGKEIMLAEGVGSYDLSSDGTLVYSNGLSIIKISPDGKSETVHKAKHIHGIVCV